MRSLHRAFVLDRSALTDKPFLRVGMQYVTIEQTIKNVLWIQIGVILNERTEVKNSLCLLQLRRDKSPLDGTLPQLRKLEYNE